MLYEVITPTNYSGYQPGRAAAHTVASFLCGPAERMHSFLRDPVWVGDHVLSALRHRGSVAVCSVSIHEERAHILLAHVPYAHVSGNR